MYDPNTYTDPTDPANFDDSFTYKDKTYKVSDIDWVMWAGEPTLEGMENTAIWEVKMRGKRTYRWHRADLSDEGVYFLKEIAFPG